MADPGDIVDRADALMRRRRSFVAKAPAPAPVLSETVGDDAGGRDGVAATTTGEGDDLDDLPVLTDVIAIDDDFNDAGNRLQERIDDTRVALLAAEIAHAIGEQLAADLPQLIETALDSAGEQLSRGIGATMETALQDFIARRRQLALPLDDARDDNV